jgi:hypothetical protein
MSNSEEDIAPKIVTGSIENVDTGEVTAVDHYLFCGGFELNTFVWIEKVEFYTHPDESFQISIDCLGLDGYGFVFKLGLEFDFSGDQADEKNRILSDITVGSILAVKREYGIIPTDGSIIVFEPQYSSLPPAFSLSEVEEVFRGNWRGSNYKKTDFPPSSLSEQLRFGLSRVHHSLTRSRCREKLQSITISVFQIKQNDRYDMNTTDAIIALVRGLETVTVTVVKGLQCGVVGVLEIRMKVSPIIWPLHTPEQT